MPLKSLKLSPAELQPDSMKPLKPKLIWSLTTAPKSVRNTLACEHVPFIETVLIHNSLTAEMLESAQSIVITSRKAVEALAPFADGYSSLPVVAVGPSSALALKQMGFNTVNTPETHTAVALIDLLALKPLPEPILFPHGDLGGETILKHFQEQHLSSIAPVVYATTARPGEVILAELAKIGTVDVIVLGSPSAVAVWKVLVETYNSTPLIATIGPTTAAACEQAGIPVWLQGRGHTEELIRSIIERYENQLHEYN